MTPPLDWYMPYTSKCVPQIVSVLGIKGWPAEGALKHISPTPSPPVLAGWAPWSMPIDLGNLVRVTPSGIPRDQP